jgi:hypothetical protein
MVDCSTFFAALVNKQERFDAVKVKAKPGAEEPVTRLARY